MFENILNTSIFVRILLFAIISILVINIVAGIINFGLNMYMRSRGIK